MNGQETGEEINLIFFLTGGEEMSLDAKEVLIVDG